jgi:hypothetical protein
LFARRIALTMVASVSSSARRSWRSLLVLALLCSGTPCVAAGDRDADASDGCTRWNGEARRTGSVPDVLGELSGIAASRRHPGIYWAHNDSNNAGALFAIDESGRVRARFPLRGLRPRDTEDVAVGPCGATDRRSCIYLADTGDNRRRRREVWIARVPEPPALDGRVLEVAAHSFRYPDGARDTEALLVDPRTAALFVVTKTMDGLGEVFRIDDLGKRGGGRAAGRFESNVTKPAIGVRIAGLEFDQVTGTSAPDMVGPVADAMADKYWSDIFVRFVSHPLTLRLAPAAPAAGDGPAAGSAPPDAQSTR